MSARAGKNPKTFSGVSAADRRAARALYKQLKERGAIPHPWSLPAFVASCEHISGRAIQLLPQPLEFWQTSGPGDCMTGMLLTLPNQYLLLYRESDAPRYQEHQIAHELAHLLFEHEGAGRISDRQIETLFGDIFTDTDAVRKALTHNRIGLSNEQERQAEAFADLLLADTGPHDPDVEHTRRLFGLG